ncbi:HNH endonuclease [Bosea beijingensis]
MRRYQRQEWRRFRAEVIELDGGCCVQCKRSSLEGAILQVHHKEYLPGRMPWEYPYELCETLCKGCHAGEHGLVRPFTNWVCVGQDDLGDVSGECELCGNEIRYVFFVHHEKWPALEVGETCCDHLTDTTEASDFMDSVRQQNARRTRFLRSPRWKPLGSGSYKLSQKGANLIVEPSERAFRLRVNGTRGKLRFQSLDEAKAKIFDLFEDGKMEAFLRSRTRR